MKLCFLGNCGDDEAVKDHVLKGPTGSPLSSFPGLESFAPPFSLMQSIWVDMCHLRLRTTSQESKFHFK